MSAIGNFFNRIKNSIFRNNVPKLNVGFSRDLILESRLNIKKMNEFENINNYNEYCQSYFSNMENFANQYNYVDLISMMQENGAMDEYKEYLSYVQNNPGLYHSSPAHGIDHTSRVVLFAEMLCMLDNISAHDKNLIMVAAQLHDIGREDDNKNFEHGLAGKEKIERLGLLNNFSKRDRQIIEFAVASHSLEPEQIDSVLKKIPRKDRKDFKLVLDYLQDADKLDRTRISDKRMGLDPNRLASETAKRLVKVAHQNYFEFYNMISYERENSRTDLEGQNLMSYFYEIRSKGYNISFDAFNNIISEYQPGTLEMLKSQGRITDIFSYETFKTYRKPESFEDNLKQSRINPDKLFEDVTKRQQTMLLRETFNSDYMLYYNLKKNNPDAFNLLCYTDLDISTSLIAGVAEEINFSDIDMFYSKGCYFRINDILLIASNVTPEEYRSSIKNGKIEDLLNTKFEKKQENIEKTKEILLSNGVNINQKTFEDNYILIKEILKLSDVSLFKEPNIDKYSIPEIFVAITKLNDAKEKAGFGEKENFDFDSHTVVDLLEYTRNAGVMYKVATEDDQLDVVRDFVTNRKLAQDPRYIQYAIKKNKPYNANTPDEILNYKEYCADQILLDDLNLEKAKSKLINALFDIDVPQEYRAEFERELVETLYYHRKYLPNSTLYSFDGDVMGKIGEILDSTNITDFKNRLFENKHFINSFNTEQIAVYMKGDLIDVSRNDMTFKLQETSRQISQMPEYTVVATNGRNVSAKILSGEEFYLATSTAMPKCSGVVNRILKKDANKAKETIYNEMINAKMNPNDICTSISSDKMIAHAQSALANQELIYAYVPQNKDSISIAAMYDLSTTRKKGEHRTTKRSTTPRNISDFVSGTTEEHNEVVMNNVYPRYIVCYDQISDIAIEKQEALKREYINKGINQPIDIVLVDSKGTYIPRIKESIEQEHINIMRKLDEGRLTVGDFSNMFEKHETNIVLRTLQAIHSTSFRDDTWDHGYNKKLLGSLTEILDKVTEIVPPNKSRTVLKQVETLIERADRKSSGYGSRYYDHSYAEDIDVMSLEELQERLYKKVEPYESGIDYTKQNKNMQSRDSNNPQNIER